VAELADVVRRAAASGLVVYPCGGRTGWHLGLPPLRPGIFLETGRLDRVVDYPARDMTITVQAGMTVARLAELLATEKQRLPIDVPRADRATIGGALAANISGPRRYGYGTLRDYVIGISAVNDEGHEIKAGGRVVKNVAGYDLCKLFVGSLGTLGVITQVTFKLRPAVEDEALFVLPCPPAEVQTVLDSLHGSRTRPACIELLNPSATASVCPRAGEIGPGSWCVAVGFEANADALQWQVKQLVEEVGGRWSVQGALGWCTAPLWRGLIEFGCAEEGVLSFKAGVPSSSVAAFCQMTDQWLAPVKLVAHAGNGIVLGHCLGEESAELVSRLRRTRVLALEQGGHLVVTRCPAHWKNAEFVWGPPRGDWELMRAVKEKLDPRNIFNPGRFVGGI
jgi:glycolate oxidase FAD binding subunit